ncbi:hypothetical protein [Cohnella soli]|uniref:Glycoside hydrolase family 42 N-terminal domain-containing protein n=1 Tax=Cohnella soli TaxID=425005 RepID=A0ABW0HSL0_9BACL
MRKMKSLPLLALSLLLLVGSISPAYAYSPAIQPFPIGVFWPPAPVDTTNARYQEIKDMNANLIVGGNGVNVASINDVALTLAANNGLKMLVDEYKLAWRDQEVSQTTNGFGLNVSNTAALGQTFTTPSGTDWALNTVQMYIDKNNWPSGVTLTLKVYNSPAKTTLISSDSITGPVSTYYPQFIVAKALQSNTSYYMELTSNSPTSVGWVVTSSADAYGGGQAYVNGAAQNMDFWFKLLFSQRAYNDGGRPADADLDAIAAHYNANPALQGYHVYDEPSALQMTRVQDTIRRLKTGDPNHMSFVNLLPTYASLSQLGVNQFTGEFVSASQSLGQTFKTKPGQTSINTVQWWIDRGTWGSGESLTLKLWNSAAKTSLIASQTLSSTPANNWPLFTLNASVQPNTTYYMELTHNGGGDNSIGWVVRSNNGSKWINDGTGYVNGSAIASDFWFTLNQNIQGGTYEDYVYRWASKDPDVLIFDHYPFLTNGGMTTDYYTNLEIIRRQALAANIDFWPYIQSVGFNNTNRAPSQSDLRYQIYTSLAYGAKGYIYFTYWTPASSGGESFSQGLILPNGTKNTSYTWASAINAEVLQLGPVLMSLTSQAVYHTGSALPASTTALPGTFFWKPDDASAPLIISYFTDGSGRKYVMVVNRDIGSARTVSFTLSPKPASVKEISKSNGTEINTNYNAATGAISATFAAGEGKLFALPVGY